MKLLNLARAARLVGTSRGVLQQKIRSGELQSFDGQVALEELQRVFPEASLSDDTVFEHVEGIKERAFGRRVAERVLPPAEVLAARVQELTKELSQTHVLLDHTTRILEGLNQLLRDWRREGGARAEIAAQLSAWLNDWLLAAPPTDHRALALLARDSLLKVMAAQVKVLGSGEVFFVEGGDTILEAALRAGVPLAYGCSSGECGACRARVVSGEVRAVRAHAYKLTPDMRARGEALMCSCTAVTDVVIDAQVAHGPEDIPVQNIVAEVRGVEFPSEEVAVLHLRTPRRSRLRFLAGQAARLVFGQTLALALPIASCPCEDRHLEFHVRRVRGHPFSEHVFGALAPGEEVRVEGPTGDFILDLSSTRPLLFIAFDTGFAPIKSLIEHALALENAPSIQLLWIVGRPRLFYAANLARAWADALDHFHFTPVLAGPDLEASASRQRAAGTRALSEGLGDLLLPDYDVFVAGPALAVAAARAELAARGLPALRLKTWELA